MNRYGVSRGKESFITHRFKHERFNWGVLKTGQSLLLDFTTKTLSYTVIISLELRLIEIE